jgi:hypothetical protein
VRERDAWCWRWVDEVLWDSRYALRQFRQHPGFTAVSTTMLALGIGVNAAVFTVASAVLSRGFRLIDRNDRIPYIQRRPRPPSSRDRPTRVPALRTETARR